MSIAVQVHPDEYRVVLYPAKGDTGTFVTVKMLEGDAQVSVFLHTAAGCDALIRAAVEAKDKLIEATGPVVRVAADTDETPASAK